MKQALRNEWTDYARKHGLLDPAPQDAAGIYTAAPEAKSPKYGNKHVVVDGHLFDSKKESQRYQELKLMRQAKQIEELELQPMFPLHVMELHRSGGVPIKIATVGIFTADFRYVDLASGEIVVEDVKSEATKHTAYRLRKKIAEAVHGITIREL